MRVKNGEIVKGEFSPKIQRALVEEAVQVAKKKELS